MALASVKRIHQNYIPALDSLRGIAILLVITFHYFGAYFHLFSFGWSGVDLFFVLSGYLITSRLAATRKDPNYFSKFYRNRALRILPLYYLVLILCYIGFNFLAKESHPGLQYYSRNAASFFLFLDNWTMIKTNVPAENQLQHFWSLAVEEQFYIIWPLIIYFLADKKNLLVFLFAAILLIISARSFLYLKYPGFVNYPHYFYNTFCRMDGFIIGAIVYFIQLKKIEKYFKYFFPLTLLILIVGIAIEGTDFIGPFMSTVGYSLVAIFYGGLVLFATKRETQKSRAVILNSNWLVFLGKISYGLYIFHWLVLRFLQGKIIHYLDFYFSASQQLALWISLFICLIISLLLSIISYFYFELYFLKRKVR